jgi:predicted flap endonuclease-1-like 5' DNA nuclease
MNFWTGLILGLIIGWVIEWIIDWLFWRRDAAESGDQDALVQERLATAEASVAQLDTEWQNRLAAADQDYHTRLSAVEQEWQSRLQVNEQEWATKFAQLESENGDLHARLADLMAPAAVIGAGVVAHRAEPDVEADEIDELDVRYEVTTEPAAEVDLEVAPAAILAPLLVDMGEDNDEDAPIVGATKFLQDDLTRIHGIGPKYAQVLSNAGIASFAALAAATPDELRAIISPGPMQQLNFESWIAQAAAFNESRAVQIGDDLTMLEGIGPIYAARLRDSGITTFAELAASDEARLAEIIDAPAWRRIDYGDWINQARLAAQGDTTGLKAVQDQLFRREGENLLLIRGLGERSAAALAGAGITTFAALASATPEQLEAIIRNAGVRGDFDYDAWITEATLRASGRRVTRERPVATHIVSCPQDLSAVEGIGTVFEDRLYEAGIGSYWELAETSASDLAAILGFQTFQEENLSAIKASAMQLAVQTNSLGRSWDGTPPDNFEILEGLGEIYERRLYEAGICTFEALAAARPEQLAEICKAPAMRTPDYNTWIATATEQIASRRSG